MSAEVGEHPVEEVSHPGVDPGVARLRAPVPEADDPHQQPGAGLLTTPVIAALHSKSERNNTSASTPY